MTFFYLRPRSAVFEVGAVGLSWPAWRSSAVRRMKTHRADASTLACRFLTPVPCPLFPCSPVPSFYRELIALPRRGRSYVARAAVVGTALVLMSTALAGVGRCANRAQRRRPSLGSARLSFQLLAPLLIAAVTFPRGLVDRGRRCL